MRYNNIFNAWKFFPELPVFLRICVLLKFLTFIMNHTCFPPQTVICVNLRSLLLFLIFFWKIQEVWHHLHKTHHVIMLHIIHDTNLTVYEQMSHALILSFSLPHAPCWLLQSEPAAQLGSCLSPSGYNRKCSSNQGSSAGSAAPQGDRAGLPEPVHTDLSCPCGQSKCIGRQRPYSEQYYVWFCFTK